jgi:hypothetical protein
VSFDTRLTSDLFSAVLRILIVKDQLTIDGISNGFQHDHIVKKYLVKQPKNWLATGKRNHFQFEFFSGASV